MPITSSVTVNQGGKQAAAMSPSPQVRPGVENFSVRMDRDKFSQLIRVHGYDVIWEKAAFCPFFRGPNPKDHDITCRRCRNGFIYYDPRPTQMLVSSLSISQQYFAYGHFASGKAQITAPPEFKVSFWDRITLCKSRLRCNEIVTRVRSSLTDKFKFTPVGVERIAWADGDQIREAADADFSLTTDGITWLTTNRPNADTLYTVVYYCRPVYVVLDAPHHVRDLQVDNNGLACGDTAEFPVQVTAQLERFNRDEGVDPSDEDYAANPLEQNQIEPLRDGA